MDRYARRMHFERIYALRDAYGKLGPEDTTSCISIEAVIAFAIEELERDVPAVETQADPSGADR